MSALSDRHQRELSLLERGHRVVSCEFNENDLTSGARRSALAWRCFGPLDGAVAAADKRTAAEKAAAVSAVRAAVAS